MTVKKLQKKAKLRNAEYFGLQEVLDRLYAQSAENKRYTVLMELVAADENILLAYRNISKNKGSKTAGKNIADQELKDAMKDSGLGTPATRAGIIENIIKTGYIKREGKKLIPTETAYTFIDLVTDKIKEPELTADWEKQLADIQQGKEAPADFMDGITGFIRSFVVDTKALYSPEQSSGVFKSERESIAICPKCGKGIVEYPKSYSCESGRNGCGFVVWKTVAGKAITKAQAVKLISKGKTDVIKGFTSKAGKPFDAHLVLKEDKTLGFEFPQRK